MEGITKRRCINFVGNPRIKIVRRKNAPRSDDSEDVLVSGESANLSGLYAIEHNSHADGVEQREIFIRKGTTLPLCQDCGNPIRFRLLKKMDYIAEDPDFR